MKLQGEGAAQSHFIPTRPTFGPYLLISVLLHALLLAVGVIYSKYFQGPPLLDLDQKPIHASLVRRGPEREEKLLPQKEEPPPPPPKAAEAPPPEPVKEPEKPKVAVPIPDLKPPPPAKPEKKAGEKDGADRKKLFNAFDRLSKSTPTRPLAGKADGDARGDSAIAEGEQYYGLLKAQVARHYNVSDAIPEQERIRLKARVRLRIDRDGSVLSVELAKSSGNVLFDAAVLNAVRQASPFAPPPDQLRKEMHQGVSFEFTP